jgi:hypothetical protein
MTIIKSRDSLDFDKPTGAGMEGEIREFVRRDRDRDREPASPRRDAGREADSDLVANNINALIQRVAGTSVQEIDRLIAELQILRDRLHSEGNRVQREIAEYARLSQSAMQSTKIIADGLSNWKSAADARSARG